MRITIILGLCLLFAACAPIPPKTTSVEPAPKRAEPKPKRFDGLSAIAQRSAPARDSIRDRYRFDRAYVATDIDGLRYFFYEPKGKPEVVGFTFLNTGSPKVNPVGLKRKGPRREYSFLFVDRAREDIHLAINDDVKISGRFSHDNMFRELHFFPRVSLPALETDTGNGRLRMTLPTGEHVLIDRSTKELVGGALVESPIDFNRSRHKRHNPKVRYRGKYLAISIAQRGEAPRRAKVWGQTKYAEVHYPAKYKKSCRISPKHIWDQRPAPGDSDPKLTMLHDKDEALFKVIEQHCGWNLAELRASRKMLLGANP